MKTWHKIAIALVVPTIIVVGFVAYKKFIKKEPVFSKKLNKNLDGTTKQEQEKNKQLENGD